jgi:hypothetical protein
VTRIQGLLLRIGACVALVVLVVVPPVLVASLIGRSYPEWQTLTREVEQGRVVADTVMQIASLLFVVTWTWLAITIAGESLRLRRARAIATPAARRMSTPSDVRSRSTFVHRLVRIAVLGTVTTATTISTWPTAAIASTGASLAGSPDPRPPTPPSRLGHRCKRPRSLRMASTGPPAPLASYQVRCAGSDFSVRIPLR